MNGVECFVFPGINGNIAERWPVSSWAGSVAIREGNLDIIASVGVSISARLKPKSVLKTVDSSRYFVINGGGAFGLGFDSRETASRFQECVTLESGSLEAYLYPSVRKSDSDDYTAASWDMSSSLPCSVTIDPSLRRVVVTAIGEDTVLAQGDLGGAFVKPAIDSSRYFAIKRAPCGLCFATKEEAQSFWDEVTVALRALRASRVDTAMKQMESYNREIVWLCTLDGWGLRGGSRGFRSLEDPAKTFTAVLTESQGSSEQAALIWQLLQDPMEDQFVWNLCMSEAFWDTVDKKTPVDSGEDVAITERMRRLLCDKLFKKNPSLKYCRTNQLDFGDKIEAPFYDAGAGTPFFPVDEACRPANGSSLDVAVVAVTANDNDLASAKFDAEIAVGSSDVETARNLAEYVSTRMGGPRVPVSAVNKHLQQLEEAEGKCVRLGKIKVGGKRHRALLFKVLADHVNIPCRLVRGKTLASGDPKKRGRGAFRAPRVPSRAVLGPPPLQSAPPPPCDDDTGVIVEVLRDDLVREYWVLDLDQCPGKTYRPDTMEARLCTSGATDLPVCSKDDLEMEDAPLASGAFGQVYTAWLTARPDEELALKIVDTTRMDVALKARASLEVDIGRMCNHSNIVKFRSSWAEGGTIFILMEKMGGGDLHNFIQGDDFTLQYLLLWLLDLASALEFLHSRDVVHRDIKPSNIMLSTDKRTAKLIDLGCAKVMESNPMMSHTPVGTDGYLAPEYHFAIPENPGLPADVYSFGVTLGQMCTREPPTAQLFSREQLEVALSYSLLSPTVQDSVAALVQLCTHHSPSHRPSFPSILEGVLEMVMFEEFTRAVSSDPNLQGKVAPFQDKARLCAVQSPLLIPPSPSGSVAEDECRICMEKPINTVLLECAHQALCEDCAEIISNTPNSPCPICRAPVVRYVKTFKA